MARFDWEYGQYRLEILKKRDLIRTAGLLSIVKGKSLEGPRAARRENPSRGKGLKGKEGKGKERRNGISSRWPGWRWL